MKLGQVYALMLINTKIKHDLEGSCGMMENIENDKSWIYQIRLFLFI